MRQLHCRRVCQRVWLRDRCFVVAVEEVVSGSCVSTSQLRCGGCILVCIGSPLLAVLVGLIGLASNENTFRSTFLSSLPICYGILLFYFICKYMRLVLLYRRALRARDEHLIIWPNALYFLDRIYFFDSPARRTSVPISSIFLGLHFKFQPFMSNREDDLQSASRLQP